MDNETSLFENSEFKSQFANLPLDQQETYKKAGEYMYSKNYENIQTDPQSRIDDALDSLSRAFSAGLMPSHLSDDEIAFLKGVYGEEWYEKFGFQSSDCVEKNTLNEPNLSDQAITDKNLFSDFVISTFTSSEDDHVDIISVEKVENTVNVENHVNVETPENVENVENVETHVNIEEEYENRNSGSIYNVWS